MTEPIIESRQAQLSLGGHTIVKVDNGLNSFDYSGFTKIELNVFMALCAQLVEKESDTITIPLSQLRELTGYTATTRERMAKVVMSTYYKVTNVNIAYVDTENDKEGAGHLFYNFELDRKNMSLEVSVNPKLTWVLNDLENSYTMYLLPDFVEIHNKYAKIMYMHLMQWRTSTATLEFTIDKLRQELGFPRSYHGSQINNRVIKPIIEELTPLLSGFTVETVKQGRSIIGFRFSFQRLPKLKNTTLKQEKRIGELQRIADEKGHERVRAKLAAMPEIPLFNISDQPYERETTVVEQTALNLADEPR